MTKRKPKIKVYITPNPFEKNKVYNPYVSNLFNAFVGRDDIEVLYNRGSEKLGFVNFISYINSDISILSWPENLAFARLRLLYVPYFVICTLLMRLFNNKIVWVVHNKHPHAGENAYSVFLMKYLARVSSICITHSKEGVAFFNECLSTKKKCYYIPHPVYSSNIIDSFSPEWDYIIWGEIQKRKGIVEFLEYTRQDEFFSNKKVLVCGSCKDSDYNDRICKALTPNVTYINKFLDDTELDELIRKSRCILFTYNSTSVLCSGALIFSLNYCKPIIAPKSGVFAEMPGIVSCYSTFDDIKSIRMVDNKSIIKQYIDENTWDHIPGRILSLLNY